MRHYELVLLIHPDQSDQVPEMLSRYQDTIKKANGNIHRVEDIGRLQLAYTIQNMHKAHYVIMNIECNDEVIKELETSFKFNDSILRHLLVKTNKAETEPSKLFISNNKESEVKKSEISKDDKEKQKKVETDSKEDKLESKEETEKDNEKSKE
tara:strand:+ start:20 stop:478 length:459 start_codon:yes stop_codon:yes gene_type:complete